MREVCCKSYAQKYRNQTLKLGTVISATGSLLSERASRVDSQGEERNFTQ
jgi:hypothetical protein